MCLQLLFDDKRLITLFLLLWTVGSSSVFIYIMILDGSEFLNIGPSNVNSLFGVKLDSWFKWWCVALYTFISTAIAAFAGDSIAPWITNTIQDHKTRYIPYSPIMCWTIIQIFTLYVVCFTVISIFVALTQVDFMIIRLMADFIVNHYTTFWFLRNKSYNIQKYKEEAMKENQQHTDSSEVFAEHEDTEMQKLVAGEELPSVDP